jgi:hypothetical protein
MEGSAMTTDGIQQINALLHEVVELLRIPDKASRRAAARKLDRIAVLASTLAATLQAQQ